MKTMLVTGANGMVGKSLVPKASAAYEILAPSSKELNLLQPEAVDRYLQKHKPDIIVHAAGRVGGIKANMENSYAFLYENMVMGFNVVNSAKNAGIGCFINLASSCMYPKEATNPLKESMIGNGALESTNEGYALAKISVAKLCAAIGYKTLVPCNLYGPYDKFSIETAHMIPAVIRKTHDVKVNGGKLVMWGTGLARREFMFVGDLTDYIMHVLPRYDLLPVISNVGLGYDYTILQYYEAIKEVVGLDADIEFDLTKPEGMKQKLVDISNQTKMNWQPRISLEEGIKQTYRFFLNQYEI